MKPFRVDTNVLIDLTNDISRAQPTLVTTDRHFDDIPDLDVFYAGPEK